MGGKILYKIFFCLLIFTISFNTIGQVSKATLVLDAKDIKIGEQISAKLSVEIPKDSKVKFPEITKYLIEKIEVVELSQIDIQATGNTKIFSQRMLITCFDSGFYKLPAFIFILKNTNYTSDTLKTESFNIKVGLVATDSTGDIKDVKPPIDTPFQKNELWSYLNYVLIAIIAIVLIFIGIYYYKLHKSSKRIPVPVVLNIESPGKVALRDLEKLRKNKKWNTKDDIKIFHEEVSLILRKYIEGRFKLNAMERTSNEILQDLKPRALDKKLYQSLLQIFTLSDLVKFAKVEPEAGESEASLSNAFLFVNNTGGSQFRDQGNV